MNKWNFTEKARDEKMRNPVSGEFFSANAIKNAGEALIREAIQNSLDARSTDSIGGISVRIFHSGSKEALIPTIHKKWFENAWPHFNAKKSGLRDGKVSPAMKCRFLVFEDFGTTGLIGDWKQTENEDGIKNPFFYFFRAEGATEKSDSKLGRWGIGKQVFPRSSHAQTFFGYSVTKEHPNGFLMGSCILNYHQLGQKVYRPDGYFAEPLQLNDNHIISGPITDKNLIDQFRKDFRLKRNVCENGLSIVVPWLDEGENNESGFNCDDLLIAIIDGYYFPILEKKLVVNLDTENESFQIQADNLEKILNALYNRVQSDSKRTKILDRTKSLVKLAKLILTTSSIKFSLNCAEERPVFDDQVINEETAKLIKTSLAEGKLVEVTLGLTIRVKDGDKKIRTKFNCYILKDDSFNERPCHIREDLTISNVTSNRTNGFITIVRIDKGPLADLLGDSENPAHTEWESTSNNFKNKYIYGKSIINIVANFATDLLRRVHNNINQIDKDILRSYFNDPGPEAEDKINPPSRHPRDNNQPNEAGDSPRESVELEIDNHADKIKFHEVKGGFKLSATGWPIDSDTQIQIRAAYETAKGNPFNRYQKFDFDFDGDKIKKQCEGCEIITAVENKLVIRVLEPFFSITVNGFDINRDLIVRSKIL